MSKITDEKRLYPRVKTHSEAKIEGRNDIGVNNFSEGGACFDSGETISSPTIPLQVNLPEEGFKLKTNAKLVWKRDIEGGNSLYGVEFINLNESQKEQLRRELIRTQIKELLNEIKSPEIRKQISDFFQKDMLNHITEIIKINEHLSKQKEYSEEIERKLDHLNTQLLLNGYYLEESLPDKKIMQKVKDNFRQLIGTWVYKSLIVKRAFEKPRGYPGDYKMLEIVYDCQSASEHLGKYFDNNFLKSPYAVAVRIRKDRLKEMVKQFINTAGLKTISVLNIACGSSREIKEMLPTLKTKSSVIFNCLDWDEEALKFSQDSLLPISPKNVEYKFIKEDIMNLVKNDTSAESLGKQNLIYSIGLIDYLPDRVLKKLINVLYHLLQKGGVLILTHKNKEKTFPSLPPDWFCDWKFVPRSKDEAIKLFYDCGISDFSIHTEVDDFEYIYYFTITKK